MIRCPCKEPLLVVRDGRYVSPRDAERKYGGKLTTTEYCASCGRKSTIDLTTGKVVKTE